jgi:YgiT-type zinc finger domain-containing protein
MTCLTCKTGTPQPGLATVVLEKGSSLVIFKEVPARICDNCGERYFDREITERLLAEANESVEKGNELEIKKLAA